MCAWRTDRWSSSAQQSDLITVGLNVPENVVCQISALAFHQLTTQIPREVSLSVPRGTEIPRL
jgi:predicted transcriptional regulator of viral defense system